MLFSKNAGSEMKRYLPPFCALFVGGIIYILWRPSSLAMFSWILDIGMDSTVDWMRFQANPLRPFLPNWVIYSLPQALWLYSGLSAISVTWGTVSSQGSRRWFVGFGLVGFSFEFGQMTHFIPGRFDILDLILLILIYSLAVAQRKWK